MSRATELIEPNHLRLLFGAGNLVAELARELRDDAAFACLVRRRLLPIPLLERDRRPCDDSPFGPLQRVDLPGLRGRRIAVIASGGSGALASLCGIKRAFEEAGVEAQAIAACSGAMLFASLWAYGLTADEMARFWLTMPTKEYVDPSFANLVRAAPRAFRGWGGLLRGEALERTFERSVGNAPLGSLRVPLYGVLWNIDRNRVEFIGSKVTPDLPLPRAVRMAVALPIFVEPVKWGQFRYADGGVVSIFPARPLLDHEAPFDLIVGVNCYFPEAFEGEHVDGWYERSFSVLRASPQLTTAVTLELAREQAKLCGDALELLHPVPYREIRGAKFYETFLDRQRWPDFMRRGLACARTLLPRIAARLSGSQSARRMDPCGSSLLSSSA